MNYEPGQEDIYLHIYPRPDGMVGLAIRRRGTDQVIAAMCLTPESARRSAETLTIASFNTEDMKRWLDEQRGE